MLTVAKPSTVYVHFDAPLPNIFVLKNKEGEVYFFRYLNGRTPRIKFNIPDPGTYEANTPFQLIKIAPIEIPFDLPKLPPAERSRYKNNQFVYNENLTDSPVVTFTEPGIIMTGPQFNQLSEPIQKFLLLHEKGHQFYKTETSCDLYALVNFLRMGYNYPTAYYALKNILRSTPENLNRINVLFNHIQQTKKTPSTWTNQQQ